jgi:hypothetical protein
MRRIEQAPLDAKMVYLFLKTNANFMNTPVYANVRKLYAYLVDIFEEGKRTGEMRPDLNSYAARDIFVGTMDHVVTRWLLKDMSYSLFENLEQIFQLMVNAFMQGDSKVFVERENGSQEKGGGIAETDSGGTSQTNQALSLSESTLQP